MLGQTLQHERIQVERVHAQGREPLASSVRLMRALPLLPRMQHPCKAAYGGGVERTGIGLAVSARQLLASGTRIHVQRARRKWRRGHLRKHRPVRRHEDKRPSSSRPARTHAQPMVHGKTILDADHLTETKTQRRHLCAGVPSGLECHIMTLAGVSCRLGLSCRFPHVHRRGSPTVRFPAEQSRATAERGERGRVELCPPAFPDAAEVLRRECARRARRLRLQQRWPAGHLLHQRRADTVAREDLRDVQQPAVPQRRRHAIHRRHGSRGREGRGLCHGCGGGGL